MSIFSPPPEPRCAGRNRLLLYAISLLGGLVFYSPVATLYRTACGLSMGQITLIEAISLLLCLALEIPWGWVADRIGYRRTLLFCYILFFISKIIFWRATSFAGFLAERLLLSVVMSGQSGCDTALLFRSAPPGASQTVFARYNALSTAGLLTASVLFSLFMGGDMRLSAFVTIFPYGLCAVLAFFLRDMPEPAGETTPHPVKGEMAGILRSVLHRPRLWLLLAAVAIFTEVRQYGFVFLGQLQYLRAGIPETAFGFLLAAVLAVALLGGCSGALTRRLGERTAGVLLLLVGAGSCLLLACTANGPLSFLGVAALALSFSLFMPLGTALQNRAVTSPRRATELSVYAMLIDCLTAGMELGFGRLTDRSVPAVLLLMGSLCALGVFLFLSGRRAAPMSST